MPSDDLILNVRQITQYGGPASSAEPNSSLVFQAGIGGPYGFIYAPTLVATALQLNAGTGLPLMVGAGPPGTAAGNQVMSPNFDIAAGGSLLMNIYDDGTIDRFLDNGPAGFFQIRESDGAFVWASSTAGSSGAPAVPTIQMTLDTGGNLALRGNPVATQAYVDAGDGALRDFFSGLYGNSTVWTFNNRSGSVILYLNDILGAGGAPIFSPNFLGCPTAPTPPPTDNSNDIATTAYVQNALLNWAGTAQLVSSWNGRIGAVTLQASDLTGAGGALLASPVFTGTPQAPTPPPSDDSTALATTAWVTNEVGSILGAGYAPINSPAFSGIPTAPTANPGTHTGQLATTAFVAAAVTAATSGVSSFNTRTGAVVLTGADISSAGGALLASPTFTGVPSGPTATPGTSTGQLATTAFVQAVIAGGLVSTFNGRSGAVTLTAADVTGAGGAPIASPSFTGTPHSITPVTTSNDTSIATTAYVQAAIAAAPVGVATFNGRSGAVTLQANDVSAVGGALVASPAFTGTPSAPTANPGTNTTQLATCAFVMTQLASSGVSSFNTRTGAVTLQSADVTSAGGALLAGPSFSGVPTAPTAAPGASTLQLATTAFVSTAVASAVVTFNSRTGNVTLQGSDITGAGGALLASPSFSGVPLAPTASPGTNTQQLATTAFVLAQITAGAVQSFNSRTGAVTLIAADVSAAGGALIASPTFTGTPSAPTPGASDNSTHIATTAFVVSALAGAGGVSSWNGRAGAVTLTSADINAAGVGGPYAPLASPSFTGTVGIPTLNATQINVTNIGVTGLITPSDSGIKGITDGSNALAGSVGEYFQSVQPTMSSIANATMIGITQINVGPGDWEVSGYVLFTPGYQTAGANVTIGQWYAIINTAVGFAGLYPGNAEGSGAQANINVGAHVGPWRVNTTSATSFFVNCWASFSGGNSACGVNAWIQARRMR